MPFAVVFLSTVALFVVFACAYGLDGVTAVMASVVPSATDAVGLPLTVVAVAVVAPTAACAATLLWVVTVKCYARQILKWTLLFAVAFNAASGLVLLIVFGSFGGLGMLMAAAMTYWYYTYVKSRIPFASECLRVACDALDQARALLPCAVVLAVVQAAWVLLWTVGSVGVGTWLRASTTAMSESQAEFQKVGHVVDHVMRAGGRLA